ncbi:MAG: hypothetical protein H6835_15120 [Planctomycetes bacterium]|nr:hypothetical protein [Planctomycetota bacterium]
MKLPDAERAVVDDAKVRDYLLSPSHPVGRFKAQFFARLGYSQDEWESLATDLKRHAFDGESKELDPSPYGRKFETRGRLAGPTGRAADLICIWIILVGTDAPKFVTAFPG